MSLLEKLDRIVYATRLDRLIFRKVQPRSLRWIPLFVMTSLVAGYVLMAKTAGLPDRGYLTGWVLFYGAYITAGIIRLFGPRFAATALHPLDEREMMVKARALAISGILLTGVAMLGCFYMAAAGLPGLWHPRTPSDWVNLGFGLQAGGMLLPTLIASWLEPRVAAEPDD